MTNQQPFVLASSNPGKIKEIQSIFPDINIHPQSNYQVPDADETGLTFIENAILKARHASYLTGLPALADDSGLCVDHLKGAPGIYSARYAGENASNEQHIAKLLQAMTGVSKQNRSAYFYCCLVLLRCHNDPRPVIAQGQWHGYILTKPQGEGGFGYDPLFYLPDYNKSAAELTPEQKNSISHRAIALKQLKAQLSNKEMTSNNM